MKSVFCGVIALLCWTSVVDAQRADEVASRATPLTIGQTFTVTSKILGEPRRINVYMPPVYVDSPNIRLPVLYMPDGGMAEDFQHVAGLLQVSIGNATMRPFILVGIENTQRRRDLTGPTTNPEDRKIAPRVGGSEAFRKFIRTELMPVVKARYRTTSETAIIGESLAGLFVVETFFLEPDLFDTYIAFDPSVWWNNHQIVDSASWRLRSGTALGRTVFLAHSSEPEITGLTRQLADVLMRARGVIFYYQPMPAESHATIYHPAALIALRHLFRPLIPTCYTFSLGAWKAGNESAMPVTRKTFPPLIRLDTASIPERPGFRLLQPSIYANARSPSSGWRFSAVDSLSFGWGSGFEGIQVKAGTTGDSIHGFAEVWTDVLDGTPNPRASFAGVKTDCPGTLR